MGGSDAEAVAARRASLVSELAKLERRRLELIEEDEGLEVAERVLRRLGELHYGEPVSASSPPPDGPLDALVERGLSGAKKALDLVRSAVERRTN